MSASTVSGLGAAEKIDSVIANDKIRSTLAHRAWWTEAPTLSSADDGSPGRAKSSANWQSSGVPSHWAGGTTSLGCTTCEQVAEEVVFPGPGPIPTRRDSEAEGVYRFTGIGSSDQPSEVAARSAVGTVARSVSEPASSRCPAPRSDREPPAAGRATLVGDGSAQSQHPPRRHGGELAHGPDNHRARRRARAV